MKRLLSLLLFAVSVYPVLSQEAYPKLEVSIPDGEMYQGDSIDVFYSIDASSYSYSPADARMDGGDQVGFERVTGSSLGSLVLKVTYALKGCGELLILPMKIEVADRPVYSDTVVIDVKPNRAFGHEWEIAHDFLSGQGIDARRLYLKYATETLKSFSDESIKAFVIVASREFEPYIGNPVLAYGTGNPMWNGVDVMQDNSIYHIMNRFDCQLKALRENSTVYEGLSLQGYTRKPGGVKPLLEDFCYDQHAPYNSKFPAEEWGGTLTSSLVGCGPVALAEVLSYYHSPKAPVGSSLLFKQTGGYYNVRMSDYPFSWNRSDDDLSSLMMACAGSVSASISPWATSSSLSNFKSALVAIWGYDPQCMRVEKYNDTGMLTMIYRELDAGRPVISADNDHIFVCDGYNDDYLHLNLGWNGYCNGYYRAIVIPSIDEWQLPFSEILIDVKPLESTLEVSVNVSKPGTLAALLEKYDMMKITSLTVSGTIDGDDIQLLRRLAGALYKDDYTVEYGSLMKLDLSDATIEAGKYYATISPQSARISFSGFLNVGSRKMSHVYDLSYVSDEEWQNIINHELRALELGGCTLDRGSDGRVYALYKLSESNTIGANMFTDCENLVELYLPKKTKKVDDDAFYNCRSLRVVGNLPKRVNQVAFKTCRLYDVR